MKIFFILLCILIILLMISSSFTEHFANEDTVFIAKYQKFREVYNNFLPNWKQGITTSYGTSLPAGQPMSTPSTEQLNKYISDLSAKDGTTYPLLTEPLPDAKTVEEILRAKDVIPQTTTPIITALQWMNANLVKAHADMKDALKDVQGFEDICQQIKTCQQVSAEKQQAVVQQQIVSAKQWMEPVFDSIDTMKPLLDENNRLVAKSKAIQAKAQSGDLLPKVEPRKSPYTLPPGSGKKLSPEQEKEYQQNYAQFYALKQWSNSINRNLR